MRFYSFNIERNQSLAGIADIFFRLIVEQKDVIMHELAIRYNAIPNIAGVAPLSTLYMCEDIYGSWKYKARNGFMFREWYTGRVEVMGYRLPSVNNLRVYIWLDTNSFDLIFENASGVGMVDCPMVIMSKERFSSEDMLQRTYLEF